MSSFQGNGAWLAAVLSGGILIAGAAQAAVSIDSLSILVGGDTSAIESVEVRDEDASTDEVTEVAPTILREVTLTSTAPGGATATGETTMSVSIIAQETGVQVGADIVLEGSAVSCDECEDVLSSAAARPAVRFLMSITVTDNPVDIDWSGSLVSVLPPSSVFTVSGNATLNFQVNPVDDGNLAFGNLECNSNEFANPVFPCPTTTSTSALLDPGTYLIVCDATLFANSLDSLADPATPVEASSTVNWSFVLGEVLPAEGSQDGEGSLEGVVEGSIEGSTEGAVEGATEGQSEGEGTAEGEGAAEGEPEGVTEGEAEGAAEGEEEGYAEGEGEGDPTDPNGCAYLPPGCQGGDPTKALGDWLLGFGLLLVLGMTHLWTLRAGK